MAIFPNDTSLKKAFNDFLRVPKIYGAGSSFQTQRYKLARLNFINSLKQFNAHNPGFDIGHFARVVFFLVRHDCYNPYLSGLTCVQAFNVVSGAIPSEVKGLVCVISSTKLKNAYWYMASIGAYPPYTPADYDVLHMYYC